MLLTFHIPGPLRVFADGVSHVEIDVRSSNDPIATVREALNTLGQRHPGIRYRILTEQGNVREHINVFVGEESIRFTGGLDTPLPKNCEIFIIPAVSGG